MIKKRVSSALLFFTFFTLLVFLLTPKASFVYAYACYLNSGEYCAPGNISNWNYDCETYSPYGSKSYSQDYCLGPSYVCCTKATVCSTHGGKCWLGPAPIGWHYSSTLVCNPNNYDGCVVPNTSSYSQVSSANASFSCNL